MDDLTLFSLISSVTKSRAFFVKQKWGGRRTCLRCNNRKLWKLGDGRYRCARCSFNFRDFTGTWLERVKIPYNQLLYLLHMFVMGVPAFRIAKQSSISRSTIQRIFRLFRQCIYDNSLTELQQLSGHLELDETMFGGRRKGKRGWGAAGKHVVFGIYQRNGKVITFPVPNRKTKTLMPLIKQHTKKGSIYFTDEYEGYVSLVLRGKHIRIKKEKGRPLKDNINGVEGFWSYAKTWLYQYRGVPRNYFHHYLKEIEFRFNNRDEDLFDKLVKMLVKSSA